MPICPRGHHSQSVDYCDECGVPIGGAGAAAPPHDAGSNPSVGTPAARPDETVAGPTPCPECGSPTTGRFCESCGFDLLMARLAPGVEPSPGAQAGVLAAGSASTTSGNASATDPAAGPAASRVSTGAVATPDAAAPDATPVAAPVAGSWRVMAAADAAYYARMRDEAEPGAEPIALPAFCPERRFTLEGGEVLIGRRSRSRGIEPRIDLSGPPEDPAVSHAHALLIAQPSGRWAVVDLDSANGTYVNDATDPIRPNTPTPLADGDRVYLGAWTRLTLRSDQ